MGVMSAYSVLACDSISQFSNRGGEYGFGIFNINIWKYGTNGYSCIENLIDQAWPIVSFLQ